MAPNRINMKMGRIKRMLADVVKSDAIHWLRVIDPPAVFSRRIPTSRDRPPAPVIRQGLFGVVAGRHGFVIETDQQVGKYRGSISQKTNSSSRLSAVTIPSMATMKAMQKDKESAGMRMAGHVAGCEQGHQQSRCR
jgi:hypothetical protein